MLNATECPDVICVTETWLDSKHSDAYLNLHGFVIFRKDRLDGYGGVLIAVKSHLNPTSISIQTNTEVCFIKCCVSGINFKLGVVYRPPSTPRNVNQELYNVIRDNLWNTDRFYVVGDLNFRYIDWRTMSSNVSEEKYFLEMMNELNMIQHVSEPTRLNAILDLCLSRNDDAIFDLEVHETFSNSDHSYLTFRIKLPIRDQKKSFIYRDYENVDYELLRAHLATIDWDSLFESNDNDCNMMWTIFNSIIDNLMNEYVPVKEFSERKVPWFTPTLKRMERKKKRKYRKWKSNKTRRNLFEYRSYCKEVEEKIILTKKQYERRKFNQKNYNPKQFFNYINSRTKSSQPVANLIDEENDRVVTDASEKANLLLRQYCSVFTRDNGVLPDCPQWVPVDTICDIAVEDSDIIKAMKNMNSNSAAGPDGIHPKFINNIFSYLVKPLKKIFNLSLSTGVAPDSWKFSEVIPIYKNNRKPNNCASYRPVSLTSYMSKLLEKIIHTKLLKHLTDFDVITKSQHGFLSRKSTTTNLLECLNDWTLALDEKHKLDIIYIDLEKAFDSVSHEKLLYKLSKVGIGGTLYRWFSSFLTGRRFCVKVDGFRSSIANVDSGIPQGTILGPLLFILFINNVSEVLHNSQIQLYADDSKLYGDATTIEQCQLLERDLLALNNWFQSWQLRINLEKCEALHLSESSLRFPYSVNDNVIPEKDFCRDLGVYVDNCLKFHKHCSNVARSAHHRNRMFFKTLTCKDYDFSLFIYSTYIRPIVESGTQVWSPCYIRDIDIIEDVQRKFTKFLPGLFNVPYLTRLEILNLQTLEERRIMNDIIFMFKMLHKLVDLPFEEYFSFNTNNTRGHSKKLNIKFSRLNSRQNFFCNRCITVWNDLDESVVNITSLDSFKVAISNVNLRRYCRGRAFNV